MERSLAIGKQLIDSELDAGFLNIIVKPIVKGFYNWWADKDVKKGTLEQIRVTLDTGKSLINNGKDFSEDRQRVLHDLLC